MPTSAAPRPDLIPTGRFAPSPTGRMHLGNVFTALISWLSAKSRGGKWILRIEDLDSSRSRREYSMMIEDDLEWLGLSWDEGGIEGKGSSGPYVQSLRSDIYSHYFDRLVATGYTYPCHCSRADIMAASAPHQSDGRVIYSGHCRPSVMPNRDGVNATIVNRAPGNITSRPAATRLFVPDHEILFEDIVAGAQSFNLAHDCGDFIIRRADGAWAYQLAVVIDDALMEVTEVVRGNDLILSAAQQLYLYDLLGLNPPRFAHIPLICNQAGQRLSKRDQSMSMEQLRKHYSPTALIGLLAYIAGLKPSPDPVDLETLLESFSFDQLRNKQAIILPADLSDCYKSPFRNKDN